MSVWVRPSRYFAFRPSLPKFDSSLAHPSVTLIGQPSPNSAWLNRNVKACLATDRIFVRPSEDALADRHRVNAEFTECGALQLAIGRMVFDPLHVAAEAVALMQHRHMPVGQPRAFVEMPAGQRAQPVEMRLDMTEQRIRQMDAQEIGQRRIGPVEIHAGGIRREHIRRHCFRCDLGFGVVTAFPGFAALFVPSNVFVYRSCP